MSEKKIVFFDIDGTLWNWHNEIPESTIRAIRNLRQNGHRAFCAAGAAGPIFRIRICLPLGLTALCRDAER